MARYRLALNLEFARSSDKSFAWAVAKAAELGYRYVEPMVHTGWELLSEGGFFHSFSMEEDPLLLKEICNDSGIAVSAISAHSPLMKPEAAVPRLTGSIVFADACGARFVNTAEGVKPAWMEDKEAYGVIRYSLRRAEMVARRHRVMICIEPHHTFTKTAQGLLEVVSLVPSDWIGVNWDTGNAYLAAVEDPYEGLTRVRDHVHHVHAKDISIEQSNRDRGRVLGTPVGCACGEGLVDWERVLHILDPLEREIVLSVECATTEEAMRSLPFLERLIGSRLLRV